MDVAITIYVKFDVEQWYFGIFMADAILSVSSKVVYFEDVQFDHANYFVNDVMQYQAREINHRVLLKESKYRL